MLDKHNKMTFGPQLLYKSKLNKKQNKQNEQKAERELL